MIADRDDGWRVSHLLWVLVAGIAGSQIVFLFLGLDASVSEVFGLVVPAQTAASLGAVAVLARGSAARQAQLGLAAEPSDGWGLAVGGAINVVMALALLPIVVAVFGDDPPTQDVVATAAEALSSTERLLVALGAVLLAPVAEEVAFRGVLVSALRRHFERRGVILVSAAGFAGYHLLLDPGAFLAIPALFVLGYELARQTLKTGRLGRAVFTHMGFNLVTALSLFLI